MEEVKIEDLKKRIETAKINLLASELKINKVPQEVVKDVERYLEAKKELQHSENALEHYIRHCTVCGEWIDERDGCGCSWSR